MEIVEKLKEKEEKMMVQEEVQTEKHKGVKRGSNCLARVHSVTKFMLALL